MNRREIKTSDFDSLSPSKLREQKVSSDISEKITDQKEMNHSRLVMKNASLRI